MCREGVIFLSIMVLVGALLSLTAHLPENYFQLTLGLTLMSFFLLLDSREMNNCFLMGRKIRKIAFGGIILYSFVGLVGLYILDYCPPFLAIALFVSFIAYGFGKWLEAKYKQNKDEQTP